MMIKISEKEQTIIFEILERKNIVQIQRKGNGIAIYEIVRILRSP